MDREPQTTESRSARTFGQTKVNSFWPYNARSQRVLACWWTRLTLASIESNCDWTIHISLLTGHPAGSSGNNEACSPTPLGPYNPYSAS
ncbi:hypothetical protein PIIN_11203 [Serendipita indica DSM 11827]|uniref:Uncharacterized protein n=1 Tax=Serendipita indica (strain DSM 11827) TaxID=1109443 RepID=G4U0X8_SERID|nr:hypothetical protein PIIN_11203 [Serendipita indica DSM 11827]